MVLDRTARIDVIEVVPLRLPVKTALVESGGSFDYFDHVIVKIVADDGTCGLGEIESYPSFERLGSQTQAGIVALLHDHLIPQLIGLEVLDINLAWQRMDKAVVGHWREKSGIDIALHDLIGRLLGVPVHKLLGGKVRDGYIVEGVGYGISLGEPEVVARIASEAVEAGYRQLELKGGDSNPSADVERLRLVREAIGPHIPIKIDFNGYYDPKSAIRVIQAMEPLGVQWIEQPVRYWDVGGLAAVRKAVQTTIVVDESVESVHDLMRIISADAADAVHIKPTVKGGLTMARRLAAVAEAAGIAIVPGTSAPTGLGMAAAQAFIAVTREISGGAHGSPLDILVDDIVANPIPPASTYIDIPDRVGLGIELDDETVARYRVG